MQVNWKLNTIRRCTITVPFLFIIFCYGPAISGGSDISEINRLKKENMLLEAELNAAKKLITYLILDMDKKKIYLKLKGITLKEFTIMDVEITGKNQIDGVYSLIGRKTIFKKEKIKPTQNKNSNEPLSTPKETDTFDMTDMPSDYTLIFNEGLYISVNSKIQDGLFMSILNSVYKSLKHIRNSSQFIWNYIKKKPFTKIQIAMNKEDARALYWSLPEKTDFIIIHNM